MTMFTPALDPTLIRNVDILRRSIARVGGRLPAVSAAPPTIAEGVSLPANWVEMAGGGDGIGLIPNRFAYAGAAWYQPAPTGFFSNLLYAINAHSGTASDPAANVQGGAYARVRFATFAPQLQIGWSQGEAGYRLKVDGEYVQAGPVTPGSTGWMQFTWGDGTATYRKLRHYEIECAGTAKFTGVRVPAITPVFPWPVDERLRMLVHGDSKVSTVVDSGSAATRLHGTTAPLIAALTGQPDCWDVSVGGTGWLANGSGSYATFNQRLALDIVAPAPDVIWEMGGCNDTSVGGMTQAGMQALIETWLGTVVAALPNVIVLMTGPIASSTGDAINANWLKVANAKAAAAAKWPRNVRYIDNLGAGWLTGTGKQSALANNGPADLCIGSDGVHPTAEGHVVQAQRFVKAAAAALEGWR